MHFCAYPEPMAFLNRPDFAALLLLISLCHSRNGGLGYYRTNSPQVATCAGAANERLLTVPAVVETYNFPRCPGVGMIF